MYYPLCFYSPTVQCHLSVLFTAIQASMELSKQSVYDSLAKEELKVLAEWLYKKVLFSKSIIFELKTSAYWKAHCTLTAFIVRKGGWDGAMEDVTDIATVKGLMTSMRALLMDEGVIKA